MARLIGWLARVLSVRRHGGAHDAQTQDGQTKDKRGSGHSQIGK